VFSAVYILVSMEDEAGGWTASCSFLVIYKDILCVLKWELPNLGDWRRELGGVR
jgi:hypothetical protein